MSVKNCTSCKKQVYPVEEFKFSDHIFHKGCFRCTTCNLQLNIKNGKLADGKPYCTTHYPTVHSFAVVADTPENMRVQKNMALASQTQYKGQQDKKAEMERRRANMENAPAVPAKPTRQVGSIADFDPVTAEKKAAVHAPAASSGTVVYSSTGSPAPAAATPTPAAAPTADGAAAPTKSGYGRGGYGRASGATPAATATGQRTSAIDPPSVAPVAATVTEVQSRPTSVQQQPTPPPVLAESKTPPPALQPMQPPAQPPQASPPPPAVSDVAALTQDVAARLSVGASGDRSSLQPTTAPFEAPTPQPPAQLPAATGGPTHRALYDYDATDEDEVSIQIDDILIDIEQIDDGWMYATNQRTGLRGMLPSNYVELI